ncbi:MAG: carbohydrate kinase family protein [Gammaproteobacteria bacterium]|nr:carbohydrate kinase family protein [Gammaproteobacteria bacterium]
MTALICGSFAYDQIMVYPGRFRDDILPDKIHILNVCFVVPELQQEFGGSGGNIIYNTRLLDDDCLPMGTVGTDFAAYREWLGKNGIDTRHIRVIDDTYTAQCFITTDMDDNQITTFQVGAMAHSHTNRVSMAQGITIGIVAPDGKEGMLQHARQFAEAGVPFFFDPGQNVTLLTGAELMEGIEHANWLIFNDYEWQIVEDKTGLNTASVLDRVDTLIVTRGASGSIIHSRGNRIDIPAARAESLVDPTGCGDAYRAGLLYGLMHGMDWETTGRIASLMGKIKIEVRGTQNHRFTEQEFAELFNQHFGYSFR